MEFKRTTIDSKLKQITIVANCFLNIMKRCLTLQLGLLLSNVFEVLILISKLQLAYMLLIRRE